MVQTSVTDMYERLLFFSQNEVSVVQFSPPWGAFWHILSDNASGFSLHQERLGSDGYEASISRQPT
ncbi:MAG: hypothetical protein J5799_00655 [Bacteroidales bacterium]|nr:hypothetical protein [Bacteroidales bacterium]